MMINAGEEIAQSGDFYMSVFVSMEKSLTQWNFFQWFGQTFNNLLRWE